MDVMVTVPDSTPLDGAIVELYLQKDWRTTSGPAYAAEVRIPAPHVIRDVTLVGDLVLDPRYTPPWPGAGIKSVRPAPTDQP